MTQSFPTGTNRRLRTSYFTSVLSISLVLFLVGLLGLLVIDARRISDYVKEHVQLVIYLKDGVSEQEVMVLKQLVETSDFAKSVRYVSKQEALDSLRKELGPEAVGILESNPLPASLDIQMNAGYASIDSLERVRSQLAGNENLIDEIGYQRTQVERISRNFRSIAGVLAVFTVLLLLIAVTLINSTIKLSLYSSRFLIKSMQLVGATRSFIRRPFLLRSARHGLLAGLIASSMLGLMLYLLTGWFPDLEALNDGRSVLLLCCGLLAVGIIISTLSTYAATNRYLKLRMDDLY